MERWTTGAMERCAMERWPAGAPTELAPMASAPTGLSSWAGVPQVIPPAAGLASMVARPHPPRPLKLATTGLAKPMRKKTGSKKKVPAASAPTAAAPTPTTLAAPTPTPVSMAASNCDIEQETHSAHNVFGGMSARSVLFCLCIFSGADEWDCDEFFKFILSNLMDESIAIDNISLLQPFPGVDEEDNEDVTLISPATKKRGKRAANYSTDEDVALIMSWESVSLDPVIGVDQTTTTYWNRIVENFHHNIKTPSNRTIGSLQHRWSTIQRVLQQVGKLHWAHCTLASKRCATSRTANLAQEMYKDKDKLKHSPFTLFHCWSLLQHHEKWLNRDNECPSKRPRSRSSPSAEFDTHDEDGEGDEERERGRSPTPSSGGSTRPPGRKKEKEKLRKEGNAGGFKEAIQTMIDSKKQLAVDKDTGGRISKLLKRER